MNVLEGVANIARRSVRRITQETWEDRTLVVRISNGSSKVLESTEPLMMAGRCALSFSQLEPGQTGTIRFSSAGGEFFGNATSGCHHAGALELRIDGKRLLMAESCPFGHTTLKSHRFVMLFEPGKRTLQEFYNEMPAVFMGCRETHSTHMQGLCVRVHAVATASPAVADVVILQEDLEQVEYELDSTQQLDFAEWCLSHPEYKDMVGSAMFLAESQAVANAMRHKKMSPTDKAFNLTLLIDAFVTNGLVKLPEDALGINLSRWRAARARCLGASGDLLSPADPQVERHWDEASEVSADSPDSEIKAYIEESHMLLRTTAVRCMLMLSPAVAECKVHGEWPTKVSGSPDSPTLGYPSRPRQSPRPTVGGGRHSIAEFFRRSSSLEPDQPPLPLKAPRRSCCGSSGALEGLEREQLMYLVRNCIHLSADYTRRRSKLFGMLETPSEGVQRYRRCLGLTHRNITEHRGGQDVIYNFFSPEVFEELGDSGVSPEEVMQSLGHCAPEYRTMSTNSKSGELFLFSSDRRFIIKTLSSKELILLMRMMPAYLDHIQRWPRSLIVRYAGLYLIQRGEQFLHFVVMKSVFDPQISLHLKFDLKGSLYKRKKKSQESVGKDEDWVHSGHRLRLPLEVQREFCAQHELDAQLLESFKMMDYSVLIGVHFVEDEFQRMLEPGWGDGCLISEDCKEVYYIGIIDHSIKYGIKKQAENLLRVAQGTSDRASCVSADTYAERQLMFLYQKVMNNPSAMDIGTEGRLRVDLFEATELIAADWNGASDPYVTVKLGLCVKHTATVPINCNPVWNCSLYLPVHQAHEHQELKITVWDEDHVKSIRGNDDFLGRLSVPMSWILKGPVDLKQVELSDIPKGRLSLRCFYESADALSDDNLLTKASPKVPSKDAACCVCSPLYRNAALLAHASMKNAASCDK